MSSQNPGAGERVWNFLVALLWIAVHSFAVVFVWNQIVCLFWTTAPQFSFTKGLAVVFGVFVIKGLYRVRFYLLEP